MERKGIIKKTISKNAVQMTIVIIAVTGIVCSPLANGGELSGTAPITPAHSSLLLPYLYTYAQHSSNHGNIYLNEDEYYEPPKPPIIPIPAIIPLQAIAGVITGYGMASCGAISARYIHNAIRPAKRCDIPEAYYGSAIIGGLTGFSMGAPVGIWAVGKCFGLEGSFGKTFRGSLIGSVGITATTILITRTIELPELIATVMSGSIIGGFLGFYVK